MQVSMFAELAQVPRRADDREHRVTLPRAPHTHWHILTASAQWRRPCSHPSNHKQEEGTPGQE